MPDQIASRAGELDAFRSGPVTLICRSGARSLKAASMLGGKGFTTVNVEGGTMGWIGAGHGVS